MKLRPGITGFFDSRQDDSLPDYPIADFKRLVYAVVTARLGTVVSVTEASITPNFHTAEIDTLDAHLFILGHSNFPLVAFVERLDDAEQRLQFFDHPWIAGEIVRWCADVEIASAADLNRRITDEDLAQLAPADREQVKYWKPQTVGQLAFNWWG